LYYDKFRVQFLFLIFLLIVIITGGCAPSKKITEETREGLTMRYQMPEDRPFQYKTITNFTQTMDIKGQSLEIKSDQVYTYTVTSHGLLNDDNQLGVTIDTMSMNFISPQGEIIPDMSGVTGNSFSMLLSVVGEEKEFDGAVALEYEVVPGRVQNVASMFQNTFPDLSDRPLEIGDTWISYDTTLEESTSGVFLIVFESINRLVGFEVVNGFECARISAEINGTVDGVTHEGGIDFISEGFIEGTNTWFFANEQGILVKMSTFGSGDITIASNGEEKIVIPTKREFSIETELIR